MSKSIFRSRLFWLGALQVVGGAVELVRTNLSSDGAIAWGAVLSGVVTILLRAVTSQPVHIAEPKK